VRPRRDRNGRIRHEVEVYKGENSTLGYVDTPEDPNEISGGGSDKPESVRWGEFERVPLLVPQESPPRARRRQKNRAGGSGHREVPKGNIAGKKSTIVPRMGWVAAARSQGRKVLGERGLKTSEHHQKNNHLNSTLKEVRTREKP